MIQVERAWEYLQAHGSDPSQDVRFKVHVDNRAGSPRGVYLRQPEEVNVSQTLSIRVDPVFKHPGPGSVDLETQKKRVEFEMRFRLKSTAPDWVRSPDFFALMHNGRSFKIEVDPTRLPPGVHTAEIEGYDTRATDGDDDDERRGPVFTVPVTVVRTLEERPKISLGRLRVRRKNCEINQTLCCSLSGSLRLIIVTVCALLHFSLSLPSPRPSPLC